MNISIMALVRCKLHYHFGYHVIMILFLLQSHKFVTDSEAATVDFASWVKRTIEAYAHYQKHRPSEQLPS